MRIDVQEVDPCTKRLAIEVPPEAVRLALDRAYERLQQRVRLDGFRKGKVPRKILERYYRETIEEDIKRKLIRDSCRAAFQERAIQPLGEPHYEQVEMKEAQPFKFTATVEVVPPFEMPPYAGKEFSKPLTAVSEEEVGQALEHLRKHHAQYETAHDRGAKEDDYVLLDMLGFLEGVQEDDLSRQNQAVLLGQGGLPPELEEALLGMSREETKRVETAFPSDHQNPRLAGKKARFVLTVKEIKAPRLPELDDEFARALGPYASLEALRAKVRGELEAQAEHRATRSLQRAILDHILQEAEFPVPRRLVETELLGFIREAKRGFPPEERDRLDEGKLRADLEGGAQKSVREKMILDRIAGDAEIEVSPVEVEAEVARLARGAGRPVREFRSQLEGQGALGTLQRSLRRQKVLDYLVGQVKAVPVEGEGPLPESGGGEPEEE